MPKSGRAASRLNVGAAIIYDKQGSVLLCQRGESDPEVAHKWEFPGGKRKPGETIAQCVVRECKEELSVDIDLDGVFDSFHYDYPSKSIDFTFFNARITHGKPRAVVHEKLVWAKPADLRNFDMCPADERIVDALGGDGVTQVAVIGGGAAGLAAAIEAARAGAKVTVLEASDRVGRSILRSGNGRCNLTNERITGEEAASQYTSGSYIRPLLGLHPCSWALNRFARLGLLPAQERPEGRIYPRTNQASSVLDVMRAELGHLSVRTLCGFEAVHLQKSERTERLSLKPAERESQGHDPKEKVKAIEAAETETKAVEAEEGPGVSPSALPVELDVDDEIDDSVATLEDVREATATADGAKAPAPAADEEAAVAGQGDPDPALAALRRRIEATRRRSEAQVRAYAESLSSGQEGDGGDRDSSQPDDACDSACEGARDDAEDVGTPDASVSDESDAAGGASEETCVPCFAIDAADGRTVKADAVVVATGGGVSVLRDMGHTVTDMRPALCALQTNTDDIRGLDGVRVQCEVSLWEQEPHLADETRIMDRRVREATTRLIARERGELLFRNYGISGIVVFDLSRFAYAGSWVTIDFVPELTLDQLTAELKRRRTRSGWQTAEQTLLGILQRPVADAILRRAGIRADAMIDGVDVSQLARQIKRFSLSVKGPANTEHAQVTQGGVPMDEFVTTTLASRKVPGLYAAGEVLDVDGPCGGYNLHWAWVSGAVAGACAAQYVLGEDVTPESEPPAEKTTILQAEAKEGREGWVVDKTTVLPPQVRAAEAKKAARGVRHGRGRKARRHGNAVQISNMPEPDRNPAFKDPFAPRTYYDFVEDDLEGPDLSNDDPLQPRWPRHD